MTAGRRRRSAAERDRAAVALVAALAIGLSVASVASVAAAAEVPSPALDGVEPRVRQAIEAARREVVAATGSAAAWGRYGMVLDAHRLPLDAAVAYREAARLDPAEMRWPYYLATLFEYVDPARALEPFARAVALAPDYAPARVRFGQVLENVGRDDQAESEYRRATELTPDDPLGWLGLGRLELAAGEVDAALADLERAYRRGPEIQAVVATLARALQRAGRSDEARRRAEEALLLPRTTHHRDPIRAEVAELAVDLESRLRRARVYLEVGQLDRARSELEALLDQRPDLAEGWLLLASVRDQLDLPRPALDAARRALALDPGLAGARAVVAGALFKLGEFDQADTEARRVLAAEPDNVHALVLVALGALRGGDLAAMTTAVERAYQGRTRAARLGPLLAQLLSDLGAALAEQGRLEEAAHRADQAATVAREAGAPPSTVAGFERQRDAYRRR